MMKKPYSKWARYEQSIKVNTIGIEEELADKAVSAILSLLTFFLIAEKESKIGFPPAFSCKKQ